MAPLQGQGDACAELAQAKTFCFFPAVATGTAVSSDEVFGRVLQQSNAVECFRAILKNGTNEAKMYALVGLYYADRVEFRQQLTHLKQKRFSVVVLATKQEGVIKKESSATVLSDIERGVYHESYDYLRKHRPK